jgi:hypothetical protein
VDQDTSSTAPQPATQPPTADGAQATIEMVFRFWGAGAKAADPADHGRPASGAHAGVLALIEDAVASRRGIFLSTPDQVHDQIYVSGLRQPSDALVVSRQVQLGLQGFRGKQGAGPVAISIAIDAAAGANGAGNGVEPPHELVTLLKLSRPAQVLLTHDMCQRMEEIKGLPLKSFPGRFGVYEYLWTAEEKLDLLQSEPQLTLTAMPAVAAAAAPPAAAPKEKSVPTAAMPVLGPGNMVAREPAAFPAPRLIVFGVLGLVALIAAIAVGVHMMHAPASSAGPAAPAAAPAQTQSAPAAAQQPQSPPVQPVGRTQPAQTQPSPNPLPTAQPAEKPHTAAHPATRPASQPAEAAEQKTAPAAQPACALAMDTGRLVTLAEQDRGRGDYANAIRIFREVLACDPNNAAARSGLDKTLSAQQP